MNINRPTGRSTAADLRVGPRQHDYLKPHILALHTRKKIFLKAEQLLVS
jgi:hypothetical protein